MPEQKKVSVVNGRQLIINFTKYSYFSCCILVIFANVFMCLLYTCFHMEKSTCISKYLNMAIYTQPSTLFFFTQPQKLIEYNNYAKKKLVSMPHVIHHLLYQQLQTFPDSCYLLQWNYLKKLRMFFVSHHHSTEICIVLITGEELKTCTTGRRVKGPISLIVVGFREVCVVAEATTLQLLHKMEWQ